MTHIFVSHAKEDRNAAHQITLALAAAGLKPWLDDQELCAGDELLHAIATVLTQAEYLAVVTACTRDGGAVYQ